MLRWRFHEVKCLHGHGSTLLAWWKNQRLEAGHFLLLLGPHIRKCLLLGHAGGCCLLLGRRLRGASGTP